MTIWRIKDGIPSLADALLVAGGMMGVSLSAIPCMEPLLAFFEPRGLPYLGYFLVLLVVLSIAAAVVWLFLKNEKKIRWEIVIPRRVFGFTSTPVIFIIVALTWRTTIRVGFFDYITSLVMSFAVVYLFVAHVSIRFPHRAAATALWFQVGLAGVGVTAKFVSLFFQK